MRSTVQAIATNASMQDQEWFLHPSPAGQGPEEDRCRQPDRGRVRGTDKEVGVQVPTFNR